MGTSYISQLKRQYKKEVRAELKEMFKRRVAKGIALGVKREMEKRDRGKKVIDWDIAKGCFKAQLSVEQTAAVIGVSVAGLYLKFSQDNPGLKLGDFREKYQQLGKASLMQELMKRALTSEKFAPLKFALQNHLGMTDKTQVENSFDLAGEMARAEKNFDSADVIDVNAMELDHDPK